MTDRGPFLKRGFFRLYATAIPDRTIPLRSSERIEMKDIRDGRRTNGLSDTMRAAVAEVTDKEFEQIAAWLASRW